MRITMRLLTIGYAAYSSGLWLLFVYSEWQGWAAGHVVWFWGIVLAPFIGAGLLKVDAQQKHRVLRFLWIVNIGLLCSVIGIFGFIPLT